MDLCDKPTSDYCRLCAAETKNGVVIYSSEGIDLCLEEKIIQCLRIKVSKDDILPKEVCRPCCARLEDYHRFAEHANQVQHTLGLLIQMKNSLPVEASIADKKNNDDISITVNNDPGVDVKCEPEDIEIKEELFELPLDINLKTDDNSHIEPKPNRTDDGGNDEKSISGLQNEDKKKVEDVEIDEEADEVVKKEWKANWEFKCNHCDKIFPFKSEFDKHYRVSYNKKPIYTCSYCNKTIEKYSVFRTHCYRHITQGRHRCDYCQKGFSLRSTLHVHILAKHTTVKPFICEECGKGFATKPRLSEHIKKHKNDGKIEYTCEECGRVLHTRTGLIAHQNVHKLGHRFMCDVCGKTFAQKINMQQHVKHHTGERPFACEKCGKCFAQKAHVIRHYSSHSEERPFQCKICKKMYKTERCLQVHAKVHGEVRPHLCTYCNKGFFNRSDLKQHCNIHTGERPYACKFCERTFTNYPNWLKHTRLKHKVDGRGGSMASKRVVAQNEGTQEAQE